MYVLIFMGMGRQAALHAVPPGREGGGLSSSRWWRLGVAVEVMSKAVPRHTTLDRRVVTAS